ncbi:hypothetical protein V8E36_006161 [Tilletia maclaganii]
MSGSDPLLRDGSSAVRWAAYEFVPQHYVQLAIGFVTIVVPLWDHLTSIGVATQIWRLILNRQRTAPRLLLPTAISILVLRYLTLFFAIVWTLSYFGHKWSTTDCGTLWIFGAMATISLCWASSVVLTIRATAFLPAAVQSPRSALGLRILLTAMLGFSLTAHVLAWVLSRDLAFTTSVSGLCTNSSLGRLGINYNNTSLGVSSVFDRRAVLLLGFACLLGYNLMITLATCWVFCRIKRQVAPILVGVFLTNSVQACLFKGVCTIFCMIWFVQEDPSVGLFNLCASLSSVLTIRMLITEFNLIGCCARTGVNMDSVAQCRAAPTPRRAACDWWEGGGGCGGCLGGIGGKEHFVGGGNADKIGAGACESHERSDIVGLERGHDFRAGLDVDDEVEAIAVAAHGRSIERPEPVWRDETDSWRRREDAVREEFGRPRPQALAMLYRSRQTQTS